MEERGLIYKWVNCPNEHFIRLEVREGTEERLQPIQCPTCDARTVVFSGDLVGVMPGSPDSQPLN